MRRRLPPLASLLAFEAVAELGSFSKAGESLALTHSAISHQIKQLEDHLGVRLLQRLPSGVVPTPAGARYLDDVRGALRRLIEAETAVKAETAGRALRISVLPSFAGSILVPELLSFPEQHPSIRVEIDARPGLEENAQTDIDVFVRYGKGNWAGYENRKLIDVELFPVCSPDYLKRYGPVSKIADLARVVMLRHTMEPWEGWLAAAGKELGDDSAKAIIPAGPLYTDARLMLQAAGDGQGVALARDVLADGEIRAGRLVRLLEVHVPSRQGYYAYFRPDASPTIHLFVDWFAEVCASLRR